jgi:hypothetical protein
MIAIKSNEINKDKIANQENSGTEAVSSLVIVIVN